VCEQVVAAVPGGEAPEDWKRARDAAKAARARAEAATTAAARADTHVDRLAQDAAAVRRGLTGVPDPDTLRATLVQLDERTEVVTAARARERAARRAEADARKQIDRLADARRDARGAYRAARDALTGLGLAPPAETEVLDEDWAALVAWAGEAHPEQRTAAETAGAAAATARDEVQTQLGTLVEEATALELTVDREVSVDAFVTAAGIEAGRARDGAVRIAAELAERERLEVAIGTQQDDAAVATTLAGLLDARHFEQWLVAEALARLVDGASARFLELSAGRFSFAFTEGARDLLVVDHGQGDERRSVRTLSGGETFQGSLALALALSDELATVAAGRSARLESIFLDEGFGTLDAETLETVAATIENLGAVDRMVGIVTHVPELAARMPVQYRVARHGRAATVERVDG